ncbi:amidohydrolase family protein [Haladaptatus sp. NG-WS-4]
MVASGVIDAHVHLMPPRLMAAIRDSLSREAGWTFDHPVERDAMETALRSAGVERYFALPYAHEAGMAADLNEWVLGEATDSDMAVPFATVHGDDDVATVVREAFEAGARGLKFQCPVQECGPADPRLTSAFELAAEYDRPILFHAGTAPMFEESPHVGADQFAQFVASFPEVRACAAHMGAYETTEFLEFARRHDQVFLDTTMALSPRTVEFMGFDPTTISNEALTALSSSIMFGSDFPNVPYPYADERRGLLDRDLSDSTYRALFSRTAERFLGEER